jgi:hypothetical protein
MDTGEEILTAPKGARFSKIGHLRGKERNVGAGLSIALGRSTMLNVSVTEVETGKAVAARDSLEQAYQPALQEALQEQLVDRTAAVLEHAVEELKQAKSLAEQELAKAIAGFRQIFTTVPVEMRSNVLLKQAWAVHQALEVVRSLDAALLHLEHEHGSAKQQQHLAA